MALWFLWANERHTSMDMSAYRLRSMSSLSSALHPHVDLVNDLAKWTGVLPSNCSNNRGLTDIRKKQRLLTAVLLNTSKRYHLSEQQCLFGWGTYTHAEATCKDKKYRKKSHFYAFLFNWTYFSWILKRGLSFMCSIYEITNHHKKRLQTAAVANAALYWAVCV